MRTYFTHNNTEGFDSDTLDKMNAELAELLSDLDADAEDYLDQEQYLTETIFNKYC